MWSKVLILKLPVEPQCYFSYQWIHVLEITASPVRANQTEYVGPRKDHLLQFLFTPRGRTQAGIDLCLAKAIDHLSPASSTPWNNEVYLPFRREQVHWTWYGRQRDADVIPQSTNQAGLAPVS